MPWYNKYKTQYYTYVLRSWGWGKRSTLSGSDMERAVFFICFVSCLAEGYTHGYFIRLYVILYVHSFHNEK